MENSWWWTDQAARLLRLFTGRRSAAPQAPDRTSAPHAPAAAHSPLDPRDGELLEQVRGIVEAQLANANFGVDWLASEVGLSTRQLQRRLSVAAGTSAAAFIRRARLKHAAHLLQFESRSVSDVASATGYRDPRHFARLFRQTYGETPSEYRARVWGRRAMRERAVAS